MNAPESPEDQTPAEPDGGERAGAQPVPVQHVLVPVWPASASACTWRQGRDLVIHKIGGRLPDRCVVCNAPAHGYRLCRTFAWHRPSYYLTLLAGPLFYFLLMGSERKTARIELGLCAAHRARRRNGHILAWAGFALSFVGFVTAALAGLGALALLAAAGMLVLPVAGMLVARVVYPTRIDDEYAWLRVGRPFLDTLPPC